MKHTIFITFLIFSSAAFADQTIICKEVDESGKRVIQGAWIKAELVTDSNGEVDRWKSLIKMKRVFKSESIFGSKFDDITLQQGRDIHGSEYALIMFNDAADFDLTYQLEFDQKVLGEEFTQKGAKFFHGLESHSSEPSPVFSIDMKCSSKLM